MPVDSNSVTHNALEIYQGSDRRLLNSSEYTLDMVDNVLLLEFNQLQDAGDSLEINLNSNATIQDTHGRVLDGDGLDGGVFQKSVKFSSVFPLKDAMVNRLHQVSSFSGHHAHILAFSK
jgi:hypothetical protein